MHWPLVTAYRLRGSGGAGCCILWGRQRSCGAAIGVIRWSATHFNEARCVQLIVLGMHRSGTSVLARILNLMGLYLGPEGMSTGANSENPKGFWERRDIRLLNDAVLHSVGCDWDRVSALDLAAVPEEMQEAFDEVARRILLEMDAHRPWFIKEPRLCLLLPLWRRHLEVPLVVSTHRDPLEVAASLQRRNDMPMEAGLELWEYYTRSAAVASRGLPAVSILHSELMSDPEAVARRLHDELLELGVQGLRPVTSRELAGFIDHRLYRERGGRRDMDAYRDCRQARMYRSLIEQGESTVQTVPVGDWAALREYERGLAPIPAPIARRVRASGYDAFMLDERLKSSVRRMGRIESELEARLEERFGQLEAEVQALRGQDPANGASEQPGSLADAVAGRERAERELEKRYAELAAAARELADARQDAAKGTAAGKKLRALRSQAQELKDKIEALRRERRKLTAALEHERTRSAALQTQMEALTGSTSWRMTAPLRALVRRLSWDRRG